MIIARANADDVDLIMGWRRERVAWLGARGEDQWSIPLPRSAVEATVSAGQTWLARDGGDFLGTVTVTAYEHIDALWKPDVDPEALWHPGDAPFDALYAAKMMVPLSRSGCGLGAELLDWAAGQAWEAGLEWLRLDAWTSNPRLHDYYRGLNFQHVRTVASRVSGACFQRSPRPYRGRFTGK